MNNFSLLPSVNWNMSHLLVVNETGTVCAYGSRGDVLIIKNADKDNFCELDSKIIGAAHKSARVMGLAFVKCEIDGKMMELLASCGDDGRLKIWNYETVTATHKTLLKDKENPSNPMKFVDIDYFPGSNRIVCIAEQGYLVKWDLIPNKIWTFSVSVKSSLSCIAACPHTDDLVAIGTRFGRVVVFSIKGEGKLIHRLLCHSSDVTSISWCPVPYNVLQLNKSNAENFDVEEFKNTDKSFLLASCCSDLTIYVSRAGTDNHCETLIKLPAKPLLSSSSRSAPKRNSNMERGRVLKWIHPFVIVTFTNFNEMISLYLSKFDNKSSILEDKQSLVSMKVAHLKYDARSLHNVHKRNISCFSVCVFNHEEVDFRVWSYSSDKVIVRSGFRKNYKEKPMILPLLSGFIFSMDISFVNPDLLAIGTGDGKISVWNLSTDHYIDIKTLSRKIDNKVMSILWHPHYEGIFAFGTYEGRVGLFDVSQGGYMPTLFKTFHQKAVYRLCWAPPIYIDDSDSAAENKSKCDNLFLLAVVDGDILQYNPKNMDELPVSLTEAVFSKYDKKCDSCTGMRGRFCSCKKKSDMCYEANRDVIVIGYNDGEIRLFSSKSHELLHVISDQAKTIMSVTWHPETVFDSPNQISPYRNWLAVASEKVLVYDVAGENVPKKIATLEIHTSRVLHVAWNPHTNGRLVSCSGDNTAIIWDVINQAVIGRYTKHSAQVLCGMWSRTNKDIVVTGSSDFTCRVWSISKDTVSTVEETKKGHTAAFEPCIVSTSRVTENVDKPAVQKTLKNQTFFPSVSHEFHSSLLLDEVIERAIMKHDPNYIRNMTGKCPKHNSFIPNYSLTSVDDSFTTQELEHADDSSLNKSKLDSPEKTGKRIIKKPFQSKFNYGDLFGSKNELTNLICQEERFLEESGSNDFFILAQARDALKNKILESIEKNKVTTYHLALAASISPKLYRDACHVYIEQMMHADNIFEAVNFQLALGLDSEAISLLCEKKRFREAFTIARLRLDDESIVREVLAKWINFCNSCGSYRLGAHCYMYLHEEENASTLLSKSKLPKDAILAAKLLKFYQPERAIELAADCFRRNIHSFSVENVQEMFVSFPELKYLEPWYLALKYFTEIPNTAKITKWIIGLLKNDVNIPDDFIISKDSIDFEKLQFTVVDNSFQMNHDELNIYVSAQAALYIIGSIDSKYATSALRHFVRALNMCYNFRLVGSNKVCCDKAYPMMRLLRLMFPSGVWKKCESNNFDHTTPLYKSINAYVGEFYITWLAACDDLPISLKLLYNHTRKQNESSKVDEELCNGNENVMNYNEDLETYENLESYVDIIVNKKTKLEKVRLLLSNFLNDLLDQDVVDYYKNVSKLKKYDSGVAPNIHPLSLKNGANTVEKLENDMPVLSGGNDEKRDSLDSTRKHNGLHVADSINDSSDKLSDSLASVLNNDVEKHEVRLLRKEVERFEKERMSAPNPFIFICVMKDFLAKHKAVEPELVLELESMLTRTINDRRLLQD